MYNHLPEDETSGSKHAEDIAKILKYYLNKGVSCWFILHNFAGVSVHRRQVYLTITAITDLLCNSA